MIDLLYALLPKPFDVTDRNWESFLFEVAPILILGLLCFLAAALLLYVLLARRMFRISSAEQVMQVYWPWWWPVLLHVGLAVFVYLKILSIFGDRFPLSQMAYGFPTLRVAIGLMILALVIYWILTCLPVFTPPFARTRVPFFGKWLKL